MAIETTAFDAADYIDTPEGVEAFLEDAFESNDPLVIQNALGDVARSKGYVALAAETGMSRAALYKALSDAGNPEFATVLKVAQALGFALRPVRIEVKPVRPVRRRRRSAAILKAAIKA
jgi:probable addiction module antidote protein